MNKNNYKWVTIRNARFYTDGTTCTDIEVMNNAKTVSFIYQKFRIDRETCKKVFSSVENLIIEKSVLSIILPNKMFLDEYLRSPNRKTFFEDYDAKIAELDKKYEGNMSDILDFLYEGDCNAEMDADHCRSIYEVIKDYDDDILYGYAGRKDCAKFADFQKIVQDGIDSGDGFSWL